MSELCDTASPEHIRLKERSTGYSGHIFDVVVDDFELASSGATMSREYIRHDDAVAILAVRESVTTGPEVLLIRQYRHPVGQVLWEIPAGLMDIAGEDPAHAAARELAEETDYQADSLTPIANFFASPGCSDERLTVYLAEGVTPAAQSFEREDEEAEIETAWFPLDEVVSAILSGKLQSPSLIVGVLAFASRRSR